MSLQKKILDLKLEAALAVRHANGWQRLIDIYGEEKATAFYTSLGLNHLEKKSVQWGDLTLSREPKEHEKIAVKGIAIAQESGKEMVGQILLGLRKELISDGLEGINRLDPAEYHTLILKAPKESRVFLQDRLITIHRQGRLLVMAELGRKDVKEDDDDFDDLNLLTDVTLSRVVNDVQARIIDSATRHTVLGQTGDGLLVAVTNEINAGTVSYIDRASTGAANKALNSGRSDEGRRRSGDWERVEYSALLDKNVCGPCAAEDGQEAASEDDLTPVPNPDCEGGDWCRCFHVFITEGG